MKDKDYKLEMDIYSLLKEEPFFALLSRQLQKRSDLSIPTAGIRYNEDAVQYELIYNPVFFSELSNTHKKWVLMHELYHASLGHTQNRKLDFLDKKLANMAMDYAINSLPNMIADCPEFALFPGRPPLEHVHQTSQSAEWYGHRLKEDKEKNPDKYKNEFDGQFDDHSEFGKGDASEGIEIADQKLKEAIAKAVKECEIGDGNGSPARGWGSVSQEMRKKIKQNCNSSFKLSPKKVLASFIKASVAADRRTSVTKRNRRLPGLKFGKKYNYRANIAISIDQSGSVSDSLLAQVFEWLGELANFASFTVVPFDHTVAEDKVYVWKKGEKRQRERVLHGGTDFNAPTKYVNDRNFDGHIVITDMMASKPIRSKCQRMWLTDKHGERYAYWKPTNERLLVLG